ncbi:MAG: Eco57I restriction-modification methylase domain-containing protein, partial [Bradymonadaceae bacterium]
REVLGQEGLTREFFARFRECLELLAREMVGGPEHSRDRHEISLTILLRLIFVYFLQARGALDGDRRFVLRHLREVLGQEKGFYRHILQPLFFGVLNSPVEMREPEARKLGELPFLNGGLFEPLPIEREYIESLDWPDKVWQDIVEELLEHYHFAIETPTGGDECRAVDPEMLGKVFEGLMYGDLRKSSGSFYTPRDIVRGMVEDALVGHLRDKTVLDPVILRGLVTGDCPPISNSVRREIQGALQSVRILDPAVGTGAFLVESLSVLQECWRTLGYSEKKSNVEMTRDLIHDHLFGVDIQPVAVRLCELRLWLAILSSQPTLPVSQIPPLPNLSHRICCGDSLIDPLDMVRLKSSSSLSETLGWAPGSSVVLREHLGALATLQARYLTAHGVVKMELRRELEGLRRRMYTSLLDARRQRLWSLLEPLKKFEEGRDLFGNQTTLDGSQLIMARSLGAEIGAVDDALTSLQKNHKNAMGFSYATHFEPMASGGFDIVLTNPPWIRSHDIDVATRRLLKARYESDDHRLWPEASALGIRATFGSQVDMSALFVERSLELLRPGGRLCALVPAKLFRSLHGSALRTMIAEHHLESVEDFSEADRAMFEATTYPSIVHIKKASAENTPRGPLGDEDVRVALWQGERRTVWTTKKKHLYALGKDPGEPWLFVAPRIRAILDKVQSSGPLIGSIDALQPRRGVLTGCNDVFLVDDDRCREVLGDLYEKLSRPVLQGREIRHTGISPTRRILWPYTSDLTPIPDLPGALRAHFESHRTRLEARSDHRLTGPLWQLFRLHEELAAEKVVWRDFSMELEAAVAPTEMIPLNTVYFLPAPSPEGARLLADLLMSSPVRALALALAERARGRWRRHLAWVMRMLPLPQPALDAVLNGDTENLLVSPALFGLDEDELLELDAWRAGFERDLSQKEAA